MNKFGLKLVRFTPVIPSLPGEALCEAWAKAGCCREKNSTKQLFVIPAKAGIQGESCLTLSRSLDPRLRGDDVKLTDASRIMCVSLIFLLCISTSLTALGNPAPLGVQVAGFTVGPEDVVRVLAATADALEHAAEKSRAKKEAVLSQLEEQLIELGHQRDKGHIAANAFEQAQLVLKDKITRLRTSLEHDEAAGHQVAENAQQVVMTGVQALLNNYQEEQRRKTQVAVAAAAQDVANAGRLEQARLEIDGAMQRLRFASDPENLKRYALFLGGASLATVGSYYTVKLAYRYAELALEQQPLLAVATSRQSALDKMYQSFWSLLGYAAPTVTLEDNIVFAPELEEQMRVIAQTTQMIHDKGLDYPSLLLYGPPGTGKTWYATLLAQMAGMDYVITSADRFAQFAEGRDVQELHALLDWAESSPRGMIIFIDEIDALGANRDTLDARWVRLQNAFLARTGKSSKDFKIIGATNRLHAMDQAFVDRFAQQICVPLPGAAERERIINLYLKKYVEQDRRQIKVDGKQVEAGLTVAPEVNEAAVKDLAQKTENFSGRQLEQMIDEMRTRCYMSDGLMLTKSIFDTVATQAIAQRVKA